MARKLIGVGVLGLALAVPGVANAAGFGKRDPDQRFVPGEALVRYERGVVAAERRALRGAAGVEFEDALSLPRAQLVSFKGSVRAAIARLEDQPGVAYAQPNFIYHALAPAPNDTHFGHLWGLNPTPGVGVLPVWDRSRGAGQVIAIVDTGVDLTHPDLAGNLWTGPGGIHGADFVDPVPSAEQNPPDDFNLHGTHVAGTAAAIADNSQGVAGVAPQAQIMAVRVLDGDGTGSTSDIANGILFAAVNGAGVINLSLGGPSGGGDQAMSDAIGQAEVRNAVVVAAAGNENNNNDANPTTPCTLPNGNLICVAAVTKTGARASFSNFGANSVDVGAPGGDGSGDPDADVLSAKPSWTSVFSEDFQTGIDGWTASHVSGLDWGLAGSGLDGESATDSPSGNYQANTDSMLQHTAVSLTGRQGCLIDYWVRLAGVTAPDAVGVGVLTATDGAGQDLSGNTGAFFQPFEQSISNLDGSSDAQPTFFFGSDGATQGDGAYVDDFNLLCRASSYPVPGSPGDIGGDFAADGGAYTAIAGTSMAAPHAAGVAALVRAVDPGAPASQVVQALRNGAKPVSGMAGVTVTGGAVDAVGAIDAALAIPNTQPPPPPPPLPQPQPPAKPRVGRVTFDARRGVLSMVLRSTPDVTGVVTLRANITAARVRIVGRKAFAIGRTGRTTVRIKLRKPALRQLRRKRRLRLTARVVVKNSAGLRASTTGTIRLRLRRR